MTPPAGSRAPAPLQRITTAELTAAWAHAAVGLFGLRRLADPDPLLTELAEAHRLDTLVADRPLGWDETCALLEGARDRLPGPLGRLLRDYRLGLGDWLLLALAGESENSHRLNLALSLLQGPDGPSRPTLHLCQALCHELLGEDPAPVALAGHALIDAGILRLDGDGPLPLRALAMPPRLWAVLRRSDAEPAPPWPGCRLLDPGLPERLPAPLRAQLPRLADLIASAAAGCVAFRAAPDAARAAAAALAAAMGLRALEVPTALWQEEPALAAACRYGGWLPVLAPELGPGERFRPATGPGPRSGSGSSATQNGPMALALGRDGAIDAERVIELEVPALGTAERAALWRRLLGSDPPAALAAGALLDGPAIETAVGRARLEAERLGEPLAESHLAHARMQLGGERLRQLAQPVAYRVAADALVLPPALQRRFDDLAQRAAGRERVWDGLGASLAATVNTGVRALFVGDSGTGKTLAAVRLATCLDAPLYRVDLSAVMNKYIGESEKNLGLLLDAAAAGDAMLLIDEADALFGRRSDGGETGERFANMLTNFLLTRIEAHPGIVVLTANSRSRIDPAFTRRFDAILDFPLPGVDERRRLWRSHLGARSPGEKTCGLLAAYCDLAGGHIRNAVLAAAARTPGGAGNALQLAALIDALRDEYRKLGRTPPPQLDQLGQAA